MNVVILSDFGFVSGGAAAVAIASAKGLAARGHRVVFFTAVGPVDPSLRASGVEVVETGQEAIRADTARLASQLAMVWNFAAARALLRQLSALDKTRTIVHLHGWTKALSASVARAAVSQRFTLVCTLHDYAVACPRGSFYDQTSMDHCRLTPLSRSCVARDCGAAGARLTALRSLRHAAQKAFGGIPSRVDAFVSVTEFSHSLLERYLPARSAAALIPNPIVVERGPAADPAAAREVVMVGRLTVEKGALLLAEAARETETPLLFVGEGPCGPAILSTNPAARLSGWLSGPEVARRLREARALIFPSRWYETQGLVVAEAAALGVPTVASGTSAAVEFVEDEVTGLLFRNGDLASLKAALARLSDDALVRRLGQASYQKFWAAPPTLERHVTCLEALYRRLLVGERSDVDPMPESCA